MTFRSITSLLSFSIVTLVSYAPLSAAEFTDPDWGGEPGARTSVWENFATAFGGIGNPPDIEGSNPETRLAQSIPGAIVTGSGNIYNPEAPSVFSIEEQSETKFEAISLQTKIIGGIDPASVTLEFEVNGTTTSLTTEMTEVTRESGGFGDTVVNEWRWTLSDADTNAITIRFAAAGPHASLVSARLDTLSKAAPEVLGFSNPDWSKLPQARQSEWFHFTSAFGSEGNAPDVDGSDAGGRLVQQVPGAVVTGNGNIYNPAGASRFALSVLNKHVYDQISVQTKITGEIVADTVSLSYTADGMLETLQAETVEIGRESGPQGDTIIYQWNWETSDLDVNEFTVQFSAGAPHASLVGLRLNTLHRGSGGSETIRVDFDEPSHDRWNYPFNATPGTRARASLFRATVPDQGIDRHGTFVVVFNTSERIPSGRPEGDYKIVSARLRVLTTDNFEVPYDPSHDAVNSHLPEDHNDYEDDKDPGRPILLFGAGFRHGLNVHSWNETAPYSPENESERSVYPAVVDASGNIVDVTRAVDYTDPRELPPFATGCLSGTAPGDRIPNDTWMEFEVDLSEESTVRYLRQNLSRGALALTLTSLNGGGQGIRTFPEFHTSDSLIGEAPQLTLSVQLVDSTLPIEAPMITGIELSEAGIKIHIDANGATKIGIRWTHDLDIWSSVDDPILTSEADGSLSWTDASIRGAKFYQIIQRP